MIRTELMPHQKRIVDFIANKHAFGIFADYGTGKTLCALKHVNDNNYRKTLIVSTKTAIQATWTSEIEKHTDFKYVVLVGTKQQKLDLLYKGLRMSKIDSSYYHTAKHFITLFLVNFDGIENIFNEIIQTKFDCIIVDESTKIKSAFAKRTQVLCKLGECIDNRGIMTGWPVTENLAEIYSQIKFLDRGEAFGKKYYAFLNRHFNRVNFKYIARKTGVDEILSKIKQFCIRITNKDLKLPPKMYKQIYVDKTPEQLDALSQLENYYKLAFGTVKIDTKYIFTLINKSLQICAGFVQDNPEDKRRHIEHVLTAKDAVLMDIIDEIAPNDHKVVIWCQYTFVVDKLCKLLQKRGYNVLSITGATTNIVEVVNKFQLSSNYNILLCTQKKASESLNLYNANYAIYYSNTWSYDERFNSEARIYRKGSEKHSHVMYIDLITKNTVEDKVLKCLKTKKDLVNELKDAFIKGDIC